MEPSNLELTEVEIRQAELAWQKRRFFLSLAVVSLGVVAAATLALGVMGRPTYDLSRQEFLLEEVQVELSRYRDDRNRIFERLDELQQRQNNLDGYSRSIQAGLEETRQLVQEQTENIRALKDGAAGQRGN